MVCGDPFAGFDRFTDEASERGLGIDQDPEPLSNALDQGGVAVTDLDGDGDHDILLGRRQESLPPVGPAPDRISFVRLFENDGQGYFEERDVPPRYGALDRLTMDAVFAAVDLNDDQLPDVVRSGIGFASWSPNLGDFEFGPALPIFEDEGPPSEQANIHTFALGDVDLDGDLDALLPVLMLGAPEPMAPNDPLAALPDRGTSMLLFNEGGEFIEQQTLEAPAYTQLGILTDRDGDGDLDVYVISEFGRSMGADPSSFYRNDGLTRQGLVSLEDDAFDIGADLDVGGMGIDVADLNGDGQLDYCVAEFGPIKCILSLPDGSYYEGGAALGLGAPPPNGAGNDWSGYSLELADLDNDGNLDALALGGVPVREEEPGIHIDRIFEGQDDGTFVERTYELDFADPRRHFGLATADFDGDGFLDFVVSGTEGQPLLWMNRCGTEAWIELDLLGPPGNSDALGARVEVETAGTTQVREVHGLRTLAQSSPRLHFGLGQHEQVDRVTIRWPDGATSEGLDLPVRRRIQVDHPER